MGREATIQLPPFGREHDVVLTFEYPGWIDTKGTTVTTFCPGETTPRQVKLTPDVQGSIRVRLPASKQPRTLRLEASNDFSLDGRDTRRGSGRLIRLEIQPTPSRP